MTASKISISNIAWPGEADDEAVSIAVNSGFSGLEIAPVKVFGPLKDVSAEKVRAYSRRVSDNGLPVVAMQAILFGAQGLALFGSDQERDALRASLADVAIVAGMLGGVPCVFGAPKIRDTQGLEVSAAWEIAERFFKEVAPLFADHGSTLCFEANPTLYGCNFITSTLEAITLVERVASIGFDLHLDIGTVIQNREPTSVITEASRLAKHLHVSQPNLAPVNDGEPGHALVSHVLRQSPYNGFASIEMRQTDRWQEAIFAAAPIASLYVGQDR